MIPAIVVFITSIMVYVAWFEIMHPLPTTIPWTKLSDVLFASGFVFLNVANLANLLMYKLRPLAV